MQTTTHPDPCDAVLIALRRIARAIDLHSKQLVQRYGLTGPQALVLRNLLPISEALSVGELARRVNLSQATVTDMLDRLEKRGLVQRTRSTADKRRVLVRATATAAKVLGDALPLLQESFVAEFTKLPEWEQTLILSSLQRVAAMMDTKPEAPSAEDVPVLSADPLAPALSRAEDGRGPSGVTMGS